MIVKAMYVLSVSNSEHLEAQLKSAQNPPQALWDEYLACTQYPDVECRVIGDRVVVDHPTAASGGIPIATLMLCPDDFTNISFAQETDVMLAISREDLSEVLRAAGATTNGRSLWL